MSEYDIRICAQCKRPFEQHYLGPFRALCPQCRRDESVHIDKVLPLVPFMSRPIGREAEAQRDADLRRMVSLIEAATQAWKHVAELREAWERGVIQERDSLGHGDGTRSNRNTDAEVVLRQALAELGIEP